jgi:hypothetical protein
LIRAASAAEHKRAAKPFVFDIQIATFLDNVAQELISFNPDGLPDCISQTKLETDASHCAISTWQPLDGMRQRHDTRDSELQLGCQLMIK